MGKGEINLVIVGHEARWSSKWVEWSAEHSGVKAGRILPVFVATTSWLRKFHFEDRGETVAKVFVPRLWGNQMLRGFLAETDGAPLDHESRRVRLINGTGGAPVPLISACDEMLSIIRRGGQDPDQVIKDWFERQKLESEVVGLTLDLIPVFREIVDVESDGVDVLKEILIEILRASGASADVETCLRFFSDLGLVAPIDPEREGVKLTPLGRLVQCSLSEK